MSKNGNHASDKTPVIFYSAKWCAYCHQLQKYLDSNDITYEYLDVDVEANQQSMLEASGGRYLIPTLVINGEVYQNPPGPLVKELVNGRQQ